MCIRDGSLRVSHMLKMPYFRVPSAAAGVSMQVQLFPTAAMFAMCSSFLALAALLQRQLLLLCRTSPTPKQSMGTLVGGEPNLLSARQQPGLIQKTRLDGSRTKRLLQRRHNVKSLHQPSSYHALKRVPLCARRLSLSCTLLHV